MHIELENKLGEIRVEYFRWAFIIVFIILSFVAWTSIWFVCWGKLLQQYARCAVESSRSRWLINFQIVLLADFDGGNSWIQHPWPGCPLLARQKLPNYPSLRLTRKMAPTIWLDPPLLQNATGQNHNLIRSHPKDNGKWSFCSDISNVGFLKSYMFPVLNDDGAQKPHAASSISTMAEDVMEPTRDSPFYHFIVWF